MPRARKPVSDIEREFLAVVEAHADEIAEAYDKCIALSDKYGIPFGNHVPEKFKTDFYATKEVQLEDGTTDYVDGVDLDWAGRICPVDQEFWQSSTTSCEMYY